MSEPKRLLANTGNSRDGGPLRRGVAAVLCLLLAITALSRAVEPATAQTEFPSREITLIVPFAAGGPTDTIARIVSERMAKTLGQQIIVENVTGSGGATAAIRAKRSAPNGYTIIMGHMGTHAAAAAFNPNLAYSPSEDFEPIGLASSTPVLIIARRDFPASSLKEFIAYAHARTAPLKMAHAGVGSVSFMTCHFFNALAGIEPVMVASQGTAPAMNELLAGRVDYMCDQVVSAAPQIQRGTVKAFAVGTPARNPALPDVPTAAEAGLPQFQVSAWNALFAPRTTPQVIVARLNAALVEALDDAGVREQLLALGSEIPDRDARSPQALARLVADETAKWSRLIKAGNPAR
ncbi:MAG: tripartite tricarboxylate transporter substrate-binding protein [Xanthobacteraceae bacterium]